MRRLQTIGNCDARRAAFALLLLGVLLTPTLNGARASRADAASRPQQQQQQSPAVHEHHTRTPAPERFTRTVETYAPPDVTLADVNGSKVRLASALGHEGPVMLQFIFTTCPTICPVMSGTFAAARGKFGAELKKVRMISITIDPEHDTPERLRDYARKFRAGEQWLFLTGGAEDILAVQKSFDAYRGTKMRHEPLTFLRASPGSRWVRLDGLMSATQLFAEYKRLIAE